MESEILKPAPAAGAMVVPEQLEPRTRPDSHVPGRVRGIIDSVLFYGLLVFGVLFPVVGTLVGVLRY